MTQSPNPNNEPSPPSRRLWLLLLTRGSLALGFALLIGIAGGAWWAWNFVREDLAPLIEKNLSQTLNRPVQLGQVERFSLNSIRFGPSAIPPTPNDPDRVEIAAVEVKFNPLQLLLTQTLQPDITLIKPEVYIEQAKNGEWVSTRIQSQEQKGLIETELDVIRFRDAEVVLVPIPESGARKVPVILKQVGGQANFFDQNQRIAYEVEGQLLETGRLSLMGESRLKAEQTNLQIQLQNFLAADVSRLIKLPLDLQAGRVSGNLAVRFRQDEPLDLDGSANLRGVTIAIDQLPQKFTKANGQLQFKDQTIRLNNVDALYGSLPIQASGDINTQSNYNLQGRLKPTSVANVLDTLQIEELPFAVAGQVRADIRLTGKLSEPVLSGSVVTTRPAQLDKVDFSRISADFALSTAASRVDIRNIRAVPEAGGFVTGNGQIKLGEQGGLALDFDAENVPGDAIARTYNVETPVSIGIVDASAQIFGPLGGSLQTVVQLQAPNVAGGAVNARGRLVDGRWQATVDVNQIQLSRFEQVPAQFQGPLSGSFNLAGRLDAPNTSAIQATGNARLGAAGGTVLLQDIALDNGRWELRADVSGLELTRFSPDLRGQFSSDLRISGTTESFALSDIQAQGQVTLSQGISLVEEPLTASIRWDGEKVRVLQATAPGFSANGLIFARVEGPGAPEITRLNLDVRAQDYNLQSLPFALPPNFQLAGQADFAGRLIGTPTAPNVRGDLQLENFALNGVVFEPVLRGDLAVVPGDGVDLAVVGDRDRVELALNPNNQPESFFVQRDQAIAQGRSQGENLLVSVQNFPLSILNLSPGAQVGLGPVAGIVNGNFEVNLNQSTVVGEVAIADPSIGAIAGDEFRGRFRYANGIASLTGGQLRLGANEFLITGNVLQSGPEGPQFKGEVQIVQGSLQELLTALQYFELQDLFRGVQAPVYGRAADVQTVAVGMPNSPLENQLRRLSEIEALLQQQVAQRDAASPLPDLSELEGTFTGAISFAGSPQAGIALTFDIQGQDWKWEDYTANQVIIDGSFENGVLTLLPLRFQSEETLVAFQGQIGGETQSGQLQIENLPVEALQDFFALPIEVTGDLNATATLAGSFFNPRALGELSLVNGTLNDTPVESARGSFNYNNSRLNFGSTVAISGPDPINIIGSVPAQLPFTVPPDSNQISLNVDIENEGLALLSLLTTQADWVSGEGQVQLEVQGTLQQPIATGIATVKDATFAVQALPEPLTDVTGTVRFDLDRIIVEGVQAQYNNQGQVTAAGILPIFDSPEANEQAIANPLSVALNDLEINLKGLYRGGVGGNVIVTGTALEPTLGGEIRLMDGQVLLAESTNTAAPAAGGGDGANAEVAEASSPIAFNGLRLVLADDVRVVRPPILSFVAEGDITLQGTLANPRPDGLIRLVRGQVELFTTRFTLARSYEQTARFTPTQGLDPILNVRLVTTVPEISGSRIISSPLSTAEVSDRSAIATGFGGFQTVRIQARVEGPASQLFDNLELTSEPGRSEAEIIALIGGGFIDTFGRGDSTLGLVNLAGSAFLSNVQGTITEIGQAIGLSELRLFPTIVTDPDDDVSVLGLAAEAVVDLSGDFSVSVSRLITVDEPFRYNLLYRLSDELRLRGSTNLSGESRALIEYEARF